MYLSSLPRACLAGRPIPPRPDLHQPPGRSRLRQGHKHFERDQTDEAVVDIRVSGKFTHGLSPWFTLIPPLIGPIALSHPPRPTSSRSWAAPGSASSWRTQAIPGTTSRTIRY